VSAATANAALGCARTLTAAFGSTPRRRRSRPGRMRHRRRGRRPAGPDRARRVMRPAGLEIHGSSRDHWSAWLPDGASLAEASWPVARLRNCPHCGHSVAVVIPAGGDSHQPLPDRHAGPAQSGGFR
jgi:hypothetical protein